MAHKMIQDVIDEFCQEQDNLDNLLYIENLNALAYYDEEQGYYVIQNEKQNQLMARQYLRDHYDKAITMHTLKDFIQQIKLIHFKRIMSFTSPYIALSDKLINVKTGELCSFDKSKYAYHKVDIASTALDSTASRWHEFLDEIVVDEHNQPDKELQSVIQEMFGYVLLEGMAAHKVFFLYGTGANGKSVLLDILRLLVGKRFTSSISIQSLTTNQFSASSLVGMRLNICAEEESKYIQADRFKALVAGDPIEANVKYGEIFTLHNQAKFIFASNRMPTFSGIDEGLRRRFLIIPFLRRFAEHEQDKFIYNKLAQEIGGVLKWAIEGAQRLIKNKYNFTQAKQTQAQMKLFEEEVSSALKFFRENYEYDSNSFIEDVDTYSHYCAWCEQNGRKAMNSHNFFKDLEMIEKIYQAFPPGGKTQKGTGRNIKIKGYE